MNVAVDAAIVLGAGERIWQSQCLGQGGVQVGHAVVADQHREEPVDALHVKLAKLGLFDAGRVRVGLIRGHVEESDLTGITFLFSLSRALRQ